MSSATGPEIISVPLLMAIVFLLLKKKKILFIQKGTKIPALQEVGGSLCRSLSSLKILLTAMTPLAEQATTVLLCYLSEGVTLALLI